MVITYLLSEIDSIAKQLLAQSKSKTILFYGEMGAGKTTLIKSLVKVLGAEDLASSPTFSLVNEYTSGNGLIYHFDFYRIEDEMEALDMGIEDYISSPAWKFIEWPQKIERFLDDEVQKVQLKTLDAGLRELKLC